MTDVERAIRVLIVDDHSAVQDGLRSVLDSQSGFVPVGMAASEMELWPQMQSTAPDLVLLDYHLPGTDGLVLCRQLKARLPAPKVVIYSAYADSRLVIPAMLAAADGLLNKAAMAGDLFMVMSRVMAGERVLPPVTPADVEKALERLEGADRKPVRLLLEGRTPAEVAAVTDRPVSEIPDVLDRALASLRVEVPTAETIGL